MQPRPPVIDLTHTSSQPGMQVTDNRDNVPSTLPAWATPHLNPVPNKARPVHFNIHTTTKAPQPPGRPSINPADLQAVTHWLRRGPTPPPLHLTTLAAEYIISANLPLSPYLDRIATKLTVTKDNGDTEEYWRQPFDRCPGPEARDAWVSEVTPLRFFHCTTPGALSAIFKDKKLKCFSWEEGGAGDHGVYGRAFISSFQGDESESYGRMLKNLSQLGKNISGIAFECTAFVKVKALNSGGIAAEAEEVRPGHATHMRKEKRYCINPADLKIIAFWYIHAAGAALSTPSSSSMPR